MAFKQARHPEGYQTPPGFPLIRHYQAFQNMKNMGLETSKQGSIYRTFLTLLKEDWQPCCSRQFLGTLQ
jgi:hypothetical protein